MASPPGYVKIFGYGSLMDIQSAKRTMPRALGFRPTVLKNYSRVFSLVSLNRIINGVADFETKECASAAIRPHASHCVTGVSFDIPQEEFPDYMAREARYKRIETLVEAVDNVSPKSFLAWTVIEQTDADYKLTLGTESDAWFNTVGKYYEGSLWGRTDVLPIRPYLIDCLRSAYTFGGVSFLDNFLDMSSISDQEGTTIREFIKSKPEWYSEDFLDKIMNQAKF